MTKMKIGRVTSVYLNDSAPYITLDVHTPTGDYNDIRFITDSPNEWFSPSEGGIVEVHKAGGEYNVARAPRRSADATIPSEFSTDDYALTVDGDFLLDDVDLKLGSGSMIKSQNDNQLIDNTRGGSLTAQDTSTVDGTYGSAEASVIENNRTRIEELEQRLQQHGLIN